MYICYTWA